MNVEFFTTEPGYELEFWPDFFTRPPSLGAEVVSRGGKTLYVKSYLYPPRGSTTIRVELTKEK